MSPTMSAVSLVAAFVALVHGLEEPSVAHTEKQWLIWAYSSAAPEFMQADIAVAQPEMKDGKMTMNILKPGTNGWTCVPGYPKGPRDPKGGWKNAHEAMPLCGDKTAFAWANAYFAGEKPQLERDGWAWMLHGDQGEDNTEPGHIGNQHWLKNHKDVAIESGPHLMVMPKDSDTKLISDFNKGGPYTMFKGSNYAHIMIPAEHYYRYQDQVGATSAPKEPQVLHTHKDWLIWAYSSAAPPYLAGDITVAQPEMKDGKMKMNILKKGTNGWTCVPGYPKGPGDPKGGWKNAHEAMPFCGDAEAFKWANAYFAGETPKLDRNGWAWMLHGDQGEDNTEPGHIGDLKWMKGHKHDWIESGPHLMLMPKDAEAWSGEQVNHDFNHGSPYTMFGDSKYAHVMIPVKDYYHYQNQKKNKKESRLFSDDGQLQDVGASDLSTTILPMAGIAFVVGCVAVVWRAYSHKVTQTQGGNADEEMQSPE